ncbi:DeoR/GlpR family DNA-binding transcription regulator [Spiroplasma eriocheiris]|uniref:Lactose phosphotransferase system repressor n=1 Tax=Spiroplasma eriocheiris TaxID=315358 RepID=A0A0H3XI78_9MOLU|nr:DeoR/GlpR family DNA-binding transcription regulator [Spiroplasma eriocheiris]AHF58120.1 lactose phosphotransferase system repressor [Spiroplasma eriocheiris CCTCC M 207170]AKM54558.1 lactose phosphotransferase system repressor [Spiroplasma eriocheiris]
MYKVERQKLLLNFLQTKEMFNMNEIMEFVKPYHIKYVLLRRDLQELAAKNYITLSYGVVKWNNKVTIEDTSRLEKLNINYEAKKIIAKTAQQLIDDKDVIFVGAGTTCEEFVRQITKYVKIITNSKFVYEEALKNKNIADAVLLGGRLRERSGAFIGTFTEKALEIETFYKAFISVTNVDMEGKLYNNNETEASLETKVLDMASISYIISDSSKFNSIGFFDFYHAKDIDYFVCEKLPEISAEFKSKFII